MASKWKHIEIVIQQLDKFRPKNELVQEFLKESAKVFEGFKVKNVTFLVEVLSGCIEYKPLLDVVVKAFYVRDGKDCLLLDYNMYSVVCCLATFHLQELGLPEFGKIVKSLDVPKICKFLRFFFNDINLSTWIKNGWSQTFDSVYVTTNWIEPLLRWRPKVEELIDQLTTKLTIEISSPKKTKTEDFNLTVPKPRPVLIPAKVTQEKYTKPVPATTYKLPRLPVDLRKIQGKNWMETQEKLLEANLNQLFREGQKSECKSTIRAETPKETKKFRAQEIKGMTNETSVKFNTTAILREGVFYQRKVEQELNRLEHLLRGARDPSEFFAWQKNMREKDQQQQRAEKECRRLKGKLSHEEAIKAPKICAQKNWERAEPERLLKVKIHQELKKMKDQEESEKRKLVQQVAEGEKNPQQAQTELRKCKRRIAKEVRDESRELLLPVLKQDEEEIMERCERVKDLRAIENLPPRKSKFVDLTQTAAHGFMEEISIVELQERLALLKETKKKAEEEKRDFIIQQKHNKQQLLLQKLEQISMFREASGRAAALKGISGRVNINHIVLDEGGRRQPSCSSTDVTNVNSLVEGS